MTPRPLPGVVFLAGIVVGSIVSFFSIHMLSSSSHLRRAEQSDAVLHLTREIDVHLLCNISGKALSLQGTDSPASDSLKSSLKENDDRPSHSPPMSHDEINKQVVPKEEIHFADDDHHHGNFCKYSYKIGVLMTTLLPLRTSTVCGGIKVFG